MKRIVLPFLVALALSLIGLSCRDTYYTPAPDPAPLPSPPTPSPAPPRNSQGAQAQVTIAVPNTLTASAWVSSSLVSVTSLGLSKTATSTDVVVLLGSNDNTVTATTALSLASFVGGQSLQDVGSLGFSIGAFKYFAVIRTAGATAGLSFTIVGNDGSSSSGVTTTANQGLPNVPANAWPVELTDGAGSLISPATSTGQALQLAQETLIVSNTSTMISQLNGGLPASLGASGGLKIDGSGTALPVSGTVTTTQGNAGASPWLTTRPGVTAVSSSSLEASHLIKGSSGTHISTLAQIAGTAPTGTYYLLMIQGSSTCPADGAVTLLYSVEINHTNGTPDSWTWDDGSAPSAFTTGLCIALSSTRTTKTGAGSYLWLVGSSVL